MTHDTTNRRDVLKKLALAAALVPTKPPRLPKTEPPWRTFRIADTQEDGGGTLFEGRITLKDAIEEAKEELVNRLEIYAEVAKSRGLRPLKVKPLFIFEKDRLLARVEIAKSGRLRVVRIGRRKPA